MNERTNKKGSSYTPLILYEFFSSSVLPTMVMALVDLDASSDRPTPEDELLLSSGSISTVVELALWKVGGGACFRNGLRITGIPTLGGADKATTLNDPKRKKRKRNIKKRSK